MSSFIRSLDRRDDERGAVTVLVSLSLVVMMGFATIAVDGGNARQVRRQAQATADAAVLSALQDLTGTPNVANEQLAVDRVKRYVYVNEGIPTSAWNNCGSTDVVPDGWLAPDDMGDAGYQNHNRCILIDVNDTSIRITRIPALHVETIFGAAIGADGLDVSATAGASILPGSVTSCALCILGNGGTAFDGQNGELTISGDATAGVAVNGSAATQSQGSLNVVSGGSVNLYSGGTGSGNIQPAPTTYVNAFRDPLATLATPSIAGSVKTGCSGPGVYESIPTNCTLSFGLYVITGPTHISGSDYIDATSGVTFYFACANNNGTARACDVDEEGADLICTGNATADIVAPTSGATKDIAMYFDRNNTGEYDCRGNGTSMVTGTIYGASASLVIRGNGNCNLRSLVVVASVSFKGNNSSCSITYEDGEQVELPYGPPSLTS